METIVRPGGKIKDATVGNLLGAVGMSYTLKKKGRK